MEPEVNRLPSAFILPVVLAIVGLFLFMALLNGQRDLTVLALVVFAMAGGTKIWSRLSAAGIRLDTRLDRLRLFPQETLTLSLNIQNTKLLPVWVQTSVSIESAFSSSDPATALTRESSLLWYQRTQFQWSLIARKRGVFQIGPPGLMVGDLFGFYPKKKNAGPTLDVTVYPRLVPIKPFSMPRRDFFGIPGSRSPVEDPVYVYGLRDYQHGRPARSIHWKASARYHRLQEKICEPAEQEKILLLIDVAQFCAHRAHDEFEGCLEIAASAAVRFNRSGYAVGLATNGLLTGGGSSILPVARGRRQLPDILEKLARLRIEPSEALVDVLKRGVKLAWGTSCLSFSYDSTSITGDLSRYFKNRKIPTVSVVCRSSCDREDDSKTHANNLLYLDDICMKGSIEFEKKVQ